jgi:hypothetical protein
MLLTNSPTELTTSATDAVLAIECIVIMVCLRRTAPAGRWRATLWCWVFGLTAFASILGALAHGLILPVSTRAMLWRTLYFTLGVLVALIIVGAVYDWRGRILAARLVPWSIGVGGAFFALTELMGGDFTLFDVYEFTVMVSALAIYLFLAVTRQLKGAGIIATAILLNLFAAGLQFSHVSVQIFPFDHNGVFHLAQMVATATLGLGLVIGMPRVPRGAFSEPDSASNRSEPIRLETNQTAPVAR